MEFCQLLPETKLRLTSAQITLIATGLRVVTQAPSTAGRPLLPAQFSRHLRPTPKPEPDAVAKLVEAANKLGGHCAPRSRLRADVFTLAAWILGVRTFHMLCRHGHRVAGKQHLGAVRTLLKRLENYRKRAKRRFVSVHGAEDYRVLERRWLICLRWVRAQLLYPYYAQPHSSIIYRRRKERLRLAVEIVRQGLASRGCTVPEARELRRRVRRGLRSMQRSGPGSNRVFDDPLRAERYLLRFLLRRFPGLQPQELATNDVEPPTALAPPKIFARSRLQPQSPAAIAIGKRAECIKSPDGELTQRTGCLKVQWGSLPLATRGERLREVLQLGISRRALAKRIGVSEGTVRRDLRIARLAPEIKEEISRGASAKKLLARAQKNLEIERELQLLESERSTGRPSDEGAALIVHFLRRRLLWAPAYSLQVLQEVERKVRTDALPGSFPTGMSPARIIKKCRPAGKNPDRVPARISFFADWTACWIPSVIPQSLIREAALRKARRRFRQLTPGNPFW